MCMYTNFRIHRSLSKKDISRVFVVPTEYRPFSPLLCDSPALWGNRLHTGNVVVQRRPPVLGFV